MIGRFSLYGFLKNQRYFEPFIILFFLDKGLSFTQIGLLIGFRELAINVMEIPSGAIADLFGRRRCMMLSFSAYILAFAIFGFSQHYWQFFIAMFLFAMGEAFRTGTHKAMIFTWLRIQGRIDEKTRVYGYTRSWSKIGSAVSVILATVLVLWSNNYSYVFFFAIVPYIIGLINFFYYPLELEGQPVERPDIKAVLRQLRDCLRNIVCVRGLRRLIIESMGFEGVYKAVEDYLQPVIAAVALGLPLLVGWGDAQRNAVLVGAIYLIIYLFSAYASRKSYLFSRTTGGENSGSRFLWKTVLIIYAAMIPMLYFQHYYAVIAGFLILSLVQNFWGPMIISRFDTFATESQGATVLSVQSQAKSVSTMIIAPVFGALVDLVTLTNTGGRFWPVAAIAAIISLAILSATRERKNAHS